MKFRPDHPFHILTEEQFETQFQDIIRQLEPCRTEGYYQGFDGKELFYEYFQAENSRGAVVILHGLSEFTKKYHEFAYYLLQQGLDVFLYDQRCHGRSCRLTDRQDMIHVDKFADYEADLHCFVETVVRPATEGKPLYLYAHSMGGAVAALYLAEHPQVFRKAVLSAPMIEPLTGSVSPGFARRGLGLYLLVKDRKGKFWSCNEFDPNYKFERAQDKSYARFCRNMQIRIDQPCYRTTPYTLGWVHESLKLRPKLTRSRFLRKIRTPILMLSAERDGVVSTAAQQEFAQKCPACRQVVQMGASHTMLNGRLETITEHVQLVLDHFC